MSESLSSIYARKVRDGDLTADPAQEAVLPEFDRIQAGLETRLGRSGLAGFFRRESNDLKGLYIWGGVGRGKSMLMDLFYEHVAIEQKRRVHFHAFMQEVQAALHEARKTGVEDAILPVADEIISTTKLLCFDEMQITDIADAMIVGRLFEQLFNAGVVVVTTSNRVPNDLYKDGLNRPLFEPFIGLMNDHLVVHELTSPTDYRQNRLSGAQVYFEPANSEAEQAIEKMWREMTQGAAGHLMTLCVKGREVEVPAFHNGIGRASFWDLCGKPLGPADYLVIAEAVRVLFLENIPRLGSENFNQARRFVTLIDALYEAKVRLIATAADRPECLYMEGEGSFEFERTASRLREMQSFDWAA